VTERPRPVIVVAWLPIVAGLVGIGLQTVALIRRMPPGVDAIYVLLLCFAAIACGVCLLRGQSWARWLAVAWFAIHVLVGALHSWQSAMVHGVLLAICTYALFCREATTWFQFIKGTRP
jgi:hypothetical protein